MTFVAIIKYSPMTQKYILLTFLLSILLISACKKDDQTYQITGNIKDAGFNTTLEGVTVQLLGNVVESGVYNNNYDEVGTATTDAQGNYSIEITEKLVSGYRFYIHKDNYFDIYEEVETQEVQNVDGYTKTFDIFPISIVRVEVKNTSPVDGDDLIRFRMKNIESVCRDCCNNQFIEGTGPFYAVDKECQTRGEKTIYLEWIVTKNNYTTSYSGEILAKSFQVNTFQINY